jgi:hypothetical protein
VAGCAPHSGRLCGVAANHPVAFLRWVNDLSQKTSAVSVLRKAERIDIENGSTKGMVDIDDTKGIAALSKEDFEATVRAKPELRDILDGYP